MFCCNVYDTTFPTENATKLGWKAGTRPSPQARRSRRARLCSTVKASRFGWSLHFNQNKCKKKRKVICERCHSILDTFYHLLILLSEYQRNHYQFQKTEFEAGELQKCVNRLDLVRHCRMDICSCKIGSGTADKLQEIKKYRTIRVNIFSSKDFGWYVWDDLLWLN